MSKTGRPNHRRKGRERNRFTPDKHITVDGVQRAQPDLRKLSRAVIAIAMNDTAQATGDGADTSSGEPDGGAR